MQSRLLPLSAWIGLAGVAISAGAWVGPAAAAALPRVASMNVCTDQLVLTLADPAQIVGLSRYSHDRFQSVEPDASRYRKLSGGAEDILMLKPDVVVASQFDKRSTRELLKANGLHVVDFSVPRALDEAKDQIRRMGDIVGHPDRAAAEIARLDDAIAQARRAATGKHYRVLPLSRRGWVSGSDSLVSSLLGVAGLRNAAGDLGVGFGGYASLEAIVSAGADFILVSDAGDHAEDDGRAFLLHPALQRFYPPSKRIVIPERLTECGSALLADALDVLVKELRRVER
jgi:iron complex transport system substrate-binding protein